MRSGAETTQTVEVVVPRKRKRDLVGVGEARTSPERAKVKRVVPVLPTSRMVGGMVIIQRR